MSLKIILCGMPALWWNICAMVHLHWSLQFPQIPLHVINLGRCQQTQTNFCKGSSLGVDTCILTCTSLHILLIGWRSRHHAEGKWITRIYNSWCPSVRNRRFIYHHSRGDTWPCKCWRESRRRSSKLVITTDWRFILWYCCKLPLKSCYILYTFSFVKTEYCHLGTYAVQYIW